MRFAHLKFRADWDVVVSQVIDYAIGQLGLNNPRFVLWGRSFGGYLGPRAFAADKRIATLVADGAIYDFFQGRS